MEIGTKALSLIPYGVRAHLQTGAAYLFIVGVLRRVFPDRSLIQTEVFPDGSPLADGIAFSKSSRKEEIKMAIYHFRQSLIKASKGKSAVASAAYQSGQKLYSDRVGLTFSYTHKEEVVYSEILLPPNAPKEYYDRATLWNAVEKINNKSNSRYGRSFDIALPHEWTKEQCIEYSRAFVQSAFVDRGLVADFAIHIKPNKKNGTKDNWHLHVMIPNRAFDKKGKWAKTEKKVYANCIKDGKPAYDPKLPSYDSKRKKETEQYRIPVIDKKTGKQKVKVREGKGEEKLWERVTIESNPFNKRDMLKTWRREWAEHANQYLDPKNQIDHRSYEEQGINKIPQIHEGVAAREIAKRTGHSDRTDYNNQIKQTNKELLTNNNTYTKEINEFIIFKKLIGKVLEYIARFTGNYDLRRLAWDLQRNPSMGHEVARRQQIASGYSRAVADRKPTIISAARAVGISEQSLGRAKQGTSGKADCNRDRSAYERTIISMQKEIDDMNRFLNASDGGRNDGKNNHSVKPWVPARHKNSREQDVDIDP